MYSFYKNYSYLAYRHTIMVKHDDISLKEASKKIPMDTTSMILGEIYSIMEFFLSLFIGKVVLPNAISYLPQGHHHSRLCG